MILLTTEALIPSFLTEGVSPQGHNGVGHESQPKCPHLLHSALRASCIQHVV